MDNKLFVGNLAWAATEEDLTQLFSQYGTVESVEVLRDKFTPIAPAVSPSSPCPMVMKPTTLSPISKAKTSWVVP